MFHQRAVFAPRGLWGRAYWCAVYPFHGLVFGGMQRNIARRAEGGGPTRRATAGSDAERTVVATATIDGRRGAELKPKRTGGSTSASGPRSTPSHVASHGDDAVAVGGPVELLPAGGHAPVRTPRIVTRAIGSTIVAHARARGDGRRDGSQHPAQRVTAADRDVGDERAAG